MRILYAIQGTGNGHLSRAKEILPRLNQLAEVDVLVSGTESEVNLPMEVKYQMNGLGFVFGKKGGIDFLETYRKGKLRNFLKEVKLLNVEQYDVVISDFEPVSVWAARLKNVPCIGLSHQAAVGHKSSPKPEKKDRLGKAILKGYAPVKDWYGFHFQNYAPNIFTPVIRDQIRHSTPIAGRHYTVYLPAYSDDKIISLLSNIEGVQWEIFSKRAEKSFTKSNCHVHPVQDEKFIKSFTTCSGILCGAGFETPAEALFMGKKLMVIPMKNQYEQQCNAAALSLMGVPVIKTLKEKWLYRVEQWVRHDAAMQIQFPDQTTEILQLVINKAKALQNTPVNQFKSSPSPKQFRKKVVNKVLRQLKV